MKLFLRDDQMVGFIRFGNDFTQNFYQIEIPLKVTTPSSNSTTNCSPLSAEAVWPQDNNIDLSLALLTQLKSWLWYRFKYTSCRFIIKTRISLIRHLSGRLIN
jgi:cell surface protein SprA